MAQNLTDESAAVHAYQKNPGYGNREIHAHNVVVGLRGPTADNVSVSDKVRNMVHGIPVARIARALGNLSSAEEGEADLLHGGWYSTDEVAQLLGVDASTLRRWRTASSPQGPPFVRLSSRVTMYSVPDVQAWLAASRVDAKQAA